ncbi:MAG: hypothetical protein JSS11_00595, partial [Verrucomicrobia bacterium]|nr:hypothetical protein [Verrucomicrobiota bacterium]
MRRAARAFVVALASAAVALGADEASNVTASLNPIEAAKRDYDAIKDAKLSLEQQKLDLPKAGTPELHLGPEALPGSEYNSNPAGRSKSAQDKAKGDSLRRGQRGANWLVDAMLGDKDKAAKANGTTSALRDGTEKTDTDDPDMLNLSDLTAKKGSARDGKGTGPDEKTAPRVANPLQDYMAGWMTPKDYQLLKAAPEPVEGGAPGLPVSRSSAVGLIAGLTPGAATPPPSNEPRVNPYLAEAPSGGLQFNAPANGGPPAPPPLPPPMPLGPVSAVPEPTAAKPSPATPASE